MSIDLAQVASVEGGMMENHEVQLATTKLQVEFRDLQEDIIVVLYSCGYE